MRRLLSVIAAVGAGIAFFPTGAEACCTEPVRSPEDQARLDLMRQQLRLATLLNTTPSPGK